MTQPGIRRGCCAVVLAAGRGERFGGDKLLAEFWGAPLLAHPLQLLRLALGAGLVQRIVVVVPAGSANLEALVRKHGAEPITQPDPAAELSASLQLGLAAAEGAVSALIVLGDQPLLRLEAISALMAASASFPDAIVRPRYAADPSAPGHPVIVPARWWHLARLPDGFRDGGNAETPYHYIPLPGSNPDVDTIADLRTLEDSPP